MTSLLKRVLKSKRTQEDKEDPAHETSSSVQQAFRSKRLSRLITPSQAKTSSSSGSVVLQPSEPRDGMIRTLLGQQIDELITLF